MWSLLSIPTTRRERSNCMLCGRNSANGARTRRSLSWTDTQRRWVLVHWNLHKLNTYTAINCVWCTHFSIYAFSLKYTAKSFGQHTDSKWTFDVRTAIRYKFAHATVCALKHWTTVCCQFAVQRIEPMFDLFPVIIICILLKCYFLIFIEFSFPFFSDISVNCLCTNGQQTDVRNIRQPFVHKQTAN